MNWSVHSFIYAVFLLIKKYIHMVKKQKKYMLKGLIMKNKWTLSNLPYSLNYFCYLHIIKQYT